MSFLGESELMLEIAKLICRSPEKKNERVVLSGLNVRVNRIVPQVN
jgi:hypothetical protein